MEPDYIIIEKLLDSEIIISHAETAIFEHNLPSDYLYIPDSLNDQTSALKKKLKYFKIRVVLTNYRLFFEPNEDNEFANLIK
jgi:hypothetical protein